MENLGNQRMQRNLSTSPSAFFEFHSIYPFLSKVEGIDRKLYV